MRSGEPDHSLSTLREVLSRINQRDCITVTSHQTPLLQEQLVQWLVQAEKRFRGTLDFAYALLLLCEEATLLRYSSDHFAIKWYRSGFLIIEQGEAANSLYLILSGTVDVMREADDGTLQILARLGSGPSLGKRAGIQEAAQCTRGGSRECDLPGLLPKRTGGLSGARRGCSSYPVRQSE